MDIRTGHARTLLDMRDEDLADIGPAIKKVAQMTGAEQYNILQVRRHPELTYYRIPQLLCPPE